MGETVAIPGLQFDSGTAHPQDKQIAPNAAPKQNEMIPRGFMDQNGELP
jgi:hypothetical protein